MTQPAPDPGDSPRLSPDPGPPPGVPRWVTVFGVVLAALLLLLVVVVLVASGGEHGPGRHGSPVPATPVAHQDGQTASLDR